MTILVTLLAVIIGAVAVLHALWGIGLWVPTWDEPRLVRAVIGAKDATRMPGPIPCALVAAALLVVVMTLLGAASPLRSLILIGAGTVLILRGVLSWVPFWRRMTPQQPFASLDQYVYGPLCILLGAGLMIVGFG